MEPVMTSKYRARPDAVRSLVQPDRVHRDLYIDEEIFALEREHFFVNTWNYVGHDSQLPQPGDYITTEIAGQPLIVVRHDDGSVRVLMNRCAHKGARVVSAPSGNTGKFFRCPYHAWAYKTDGSLLAVPLKSGYDGTGMQQCESGRGLVAVKHVRLYRGFIFVKLGDAGPDFEAYFGDSLSSIDNMADRSPEGQLEIAGGCLRFMHGCNWKMFIENLNDTMHPMVVHESSAGTAKKMWSGKPADAPKPMAIEQFVPFVSDYKFFDDMGVRVYDNGHSFSGVHFSIHSKYSAVPEYDAAMKAAYGEERAARDPRPGAPQHRLLPEPDDQGRDPGHPRGASDRGGQDAGRELDLSPEGRAAAAAGAHVHVFAADQLAVLGGGTRRPARLPRDPAGPARQRQRVGQPAPQLRRRRGRSSHEITAIGTSEISMRNQYRAWARYMTLTM